MRPRNPLAIPMHASKAVLVSVDERRGVASEAGLVRSFGDLELQEDDHVGGDEAKDLWNNKTVSSFMRQISEF